MESQEAKVSQVSPREFVKTTSLAVRKVARAQHPEGNDYICHIYKTPQSMTVVTTDDDGIIEVMTFPNSTLQKIVEEFSKVANGISNATGAK